jgi:hypothetical protein
MATPLKISISTSDEFQFGKAPREPIAHYDFGDDFIAALIQSMGYGARCQYRYDGYPQGVIRQVKTRANSAVTSQFYFKAMKLRAPAPEPKYTCEMGCAISKGLGGKSFWEEGSRVFVDAFIQGYPSINCNDR